MSKVFHSIHNLDFEVAPWGFYPAFKRFRIGTCVGLYSATKDTYDILAIRNYNPGNGHLKDVFQWFERSCKRDGKNLRILALMNDGFRKHLMEKEGFVVDGKDNLIKYVV